jgi:hypothetical protein
MRTTFGPDDEDAFYQARTQLIDAYAADPEGPRDGDTFVAEMMLTYKWGYGDGSIADWHEHDLEDLLLDFFPRKVMLADGDTSPVPRQAAEFLGFLARRSLLTGDPLGRLTAVAHSLAPRFEAAMSDDASASFATRLVRQMQAEGVDPTHQAQLDSWMADFNSRTRSERDTILGPGILPSGLDDAGTEPFGADRPTRPVPPVELAPTQELDAAARASVPLERLATFTRYVERPRKLTTQGNLTRADGRALVELLDIAHEDPFIRSYQERVRSTAELPELMLTLRWAKAAGFVKVRHGTLSATKRGRDLGRHPLADWRAAFEAIVLKAVIVPEPARSFRAWWMETVGDLISVLPIQLYGTDGAPIDALKAQLSARLHSEFMIPEPTHPSIDPLTWAGDDLVRRGITPLVELGALSMTDGRVSLTPLATWALNRWFRENGLDAPVRGELVEAPALALLVETTFWPLEEALEEARRWIAARPATAATELAQAARLAVTDGPPDTDEPSPQDLAVLALDYLEAAGPAAEEAVRGLLDIEPLRARAMLWLVAHGYEDRSRLSGEELQGLLIETLAAVLDAEGPDALAEHVSGLGPEAEQVATIEAMRKAVHPRTTDILHALGQHHPAKPVAKAARKTAFQRSSYH